MYAGWILLAFSIIIIFLAGGEFRKKGGAPKGKSIVHTTAVVDSGIYAVVRHPQYLGFILFVLASVPMSQHWLSVISWMHAWNISMLKLLVSTLKNQQTKQ